MKYILLLISIFIFANSKMTEQKISKINSFYNSVIFYKSDIKNYNKIDYWASAEETLLKGSGDCEDIAILKYDTLLKEGLSSKNIKFMITTMDKKVAHVYLEVKLNGKTYYLDNKSRSIFRKIHKVSFNLMDFEDNSKFKQRLLKALS